MRTVKEAGDLKDKRVFLRVDFNIPIVTASKSFRIKNHKETIDFLVSQGAKIALVSHLAGPAFGGSGSSFRPMLDGIKTNLGCDIAFEEDILNPRLESQLTLFENIRRYDEEENNDQTFAANLAKSFDIYVNDAFSVSHRSHASVTGIVKNLPSYAGLALIKEIDSLKKVMDSPAEGKVLVIGGAKVEDKAPVIKNFIDPSSISADADNYGASKSEKILLGGVVANTFLRRAGIEIGNSVSGELQLIEGIDSSKIILPQDAVIGASPMDGKSEFMTLGNVPIGNMILDIGPGTADMYKEILRNAKTIIWNGPMGYTENRIFCEGTKAVAEAIALNKNSFSVIGGGDTLAFLEKESMLDKFSQLSSGGGAMLEFLAGKRLPGLEALEYYGKSS